MIKRYSLLLLIFILINFQVEAENFCNDECFTKTYCISSNGSGVCSAKNLVTVQFQVIPVFGSYDYFHIILKGYNIQPDDEKTIKMSFDYPDITVNEYTCYKSPLGSTYSRYDRYFYIATPNKTTGPSYYKDSVLSCTWTFNIDDPIWPQDVDLLKDSSQSITLYDDSKGVIVAQNTSQLPIYHAQYLKCCKKVHGNEFMLTFDQTEEKIRHHQEKIIKRQCKSRSVI